MLISWISASKNFSYNTKRLAKKWDQYICLPYRINGLFPAIFTSIESPFNLFPKWSDIVIPKGYLVHTSGVSTISTCREKIFPSHMALNDGYKSLGCSTIFTPISTNIASFRTPCEQIHRSFHFFPGDFSPFKDLCLI